jgi:DNA-binding CsgD family transcriptional regulator
MLTARLRDLEAAQTQAELWQISVAALDAEGVCFVTYLTVASDYAEPIMHTTHPVLYEAYEPAADPFLQHCCASYDITHTGAAYLDDYPYLPTQARNFIAKAGEVGFSTGFGIPVRLAGGPRFGGVNMGTFLERSSFENRLVPRAEEFRLFALILHRRLEELSLPAPGDRAVLAVPPVPALSVLSPREREIIWLMSKGLTRKEIARSCALSPHTVADYSRRAYAKLGVRNRVEATRAVLGL